MSIENKSLSRQVYETVDETIKNSHPDSPKAVVITPTTGSPLLRRAIESVLSQDFANIVHLLVVDGAEFEIKVKEIAKGFNYDRYKISTLPFNTGSNGMNGHRVYASFPLLVNADYIFFLDEDNWWDVDHASSMIRLLEEQNLDWAYSMRKIYTYEEIYIADDNCESIGMFEPFSALQRGWASYIDTNCYIFKRNTIAQTAHYWYHPLRADRYFFNHLALKFPKYFSTKKYTVNYRLKKNGPVAPEYILQGNTYMEQKYDSKLPWV